MKILSMHAFYKILGGEDISHRSEVARLRQAGHDVYDYTVQNSDYSQQPLASQLRDLAYNREVRNEVVAICKNFSPDVAYVNNTFPALSASAFMALKSCGVPSVQVLRNYRVGCIAGTIFRDGDNCELCVGSSTGLSGIKNGCYRGSRSASAAASGARLIQSVLGAQKVVTKYIAVSSKVREVAMASGIAGAKIVVRHNLVWPETDFVLSNSDARTVTFVGRDVPEKGLMMLIDSLPEGLDFTLNVVGDVSHSFVDRRVVRHGQLGRAAVLAVLRDSRSVVVPSLWHEPFGRVVIEGLSVGTPAIVSAVGGMAGLIGAGVSGYERGDSESLKKLLRMAVTQSASELSAARLEARRRYIAEFSSDAWLASTERILESAIEIGSERREGEA